LKEIVSQNKDGFLWETEEELKKMTLQLIESPQTREKMALQSIKASQKFSKEEFCQRVDEIIGN